MSTVGKGALDVRDPGRIFEEEAHQHLVSRLRAGAWVALISVGLFGIADVVTRPDQILSLGLLKLVQLTVIVAGFQSLRQARRRALHVWIGVAAASSLQMLSGIKGILTDDTLVPLLMFVVMAMGTASALPWGEVPQAVTVLVGLASVVADVRLVTGSFAPLLGYPSVVLVVTAVASIYFARELERTRVERMQVGALLAGQSRVLEAIATDAPLPAVLESLCVLVEGQLRQLRCLVLRLDGGRLRVVASPSLENALPAEMELDAALAEGLPWAFAIRGRERTVLEIDAKPSPTLVTLAARVRVRSIWSAPILATGGRCLGVVVILRGDSEPPSARDNHVLETATFLARVAFERRDAEAALESSRRGLEAEAGISAALVRAGNELISVLEQPVVLDRLCELTVELLGCDFCHAWLREEGGAFVGATQHGDSPGASGLRLHPQHLSRFDADGLLELGVQDLSRTADAPCALSSVLCVALRRGSQVIGVLAAGFRDGREPASEPQRRIARGIGHLASMALENSRLVAELEQASRLKSEFVSTMSHELRTPLNVVIGYADILAEELDVRTEADLVARIRTAGRELLDLIEATLDLSRIEAGQAPPRVEEFPVSVLFGELAAEFDALTRSGDPVLEWPARHDGTLRTDRRKLRIIAKNLVGNALKFTPTGRISVGAGFEADRFHLTVRDTGIGIPPEALPTIFEMFRQVDSSDSRSYSGVGLGLYIVRRLVEQLGGEISVESAVGHGTSFRVSLPLSDPHPLPTGRLAEVKPGLL